MATKRSWKKMAATGVVMTALAAVPLIYSSILTDANLDPTGNLDTVPAAVVNEDAGATDPDGEAMAVGDELADELVSSEKSNNFDWQEMTADEASTALSDGDVYAVLSIPEDFSANVVSPGEDDVSKAAVAELTVTTNDGYNLIAGNIASTIGEKVTETLRHEVSAEYLDKIYLGFTDVHESLQTAADGAGELADGTATAKDGSGELVVGLDELADGSLQLEDGAWTLSSGASTAAAGAQQLSDGLSLLESKTASLPSQTQKLDDGAQQLSTGLTTLSDSVDGVVAQVEPILESAKTAAEAVRDALNEAGDLAEDAEQIKADAQGALSSAEGVRDGATDVASDGEGVGTGASGVSASAQDLLDRYSSMSDEERLAAITQLRDDAGAVAGDASDLASTASDVRSSAESLISDSGLTGLVDAADQAASGAADASDRLHEAADAIDDAIADAEQKVAEAETAVDGVHKLRDGASALADGTSALAAATPQLTDGIASAADGAASLASGNSQLASGASTLANGTSTLADGSASAADGATQLDDGIGKLEDGSTELHDGLEDGVDEVPSYTDSEAETLSGVTASAVSIDAERENEVSGYGAGLAPYFLSLALWVGGMSFYMMASALNARAVERRRPAVLILLRSILPGVVMGLVQATIAVFSLHFWVGVEAVNLPGMFALAAFTSVTFLIVNQGLVSLLGAPGRFVALLMVVLQVASAGGTYPIETTPPFFQFIHEFLPMTYTVEGFRSLIAGGEIGIAAAYGKLAVWLVLGLALGLVASILARVKAARADGVDEAADEPEDEPGPRRTGAAAATAGAAAVTAGGDDAHTLPLSQLAVTALLERAEQEASGEPDEDELTDDADATREVPVADAPAEPRAAETVAATATDDAPEPDEAAPPASAADDATASSGTDAVAGEPAADASADDGAEPAHPDDEGADGER